MTVNEMDQNKEVKKLPHDFQNIYYLIKKS